MSADTKLGITCSGQPTRAKATGARFSKPLRQIIESINDTLNGQLSSNNTGTHHRRRAHPIWQRLLALTAASGTTSTLKRSLTRLESLI
jgi:hypothetical protein